MLSARDSCCCIRVTSASYVCSSFSTAASRKDSGACGTPVWIRPSIKPRAVADRKNCLDPGASFSQTRERREKLEISASGVRAISSTIEEKLSLSPIRQSRTIAAAFCGSRGAFQLPGDIDTRSRAGVPSRVTPAMDSWRSTTVLPNGRCVPSRWGGKTIYSWAPIAAASVPLPSTASSDQQNSTASIRSSISAQSWPRSPTTQSAASSNSCRGTSLHHLRPTPPKLLSHTQQVSTKNKWTLQDKTHPIKSRGESRTLTIEPEALQNISTSAAKDEDMARQRLLFEHRLHLGAEPVKAAPHVRHPSRDPDLRAGGKRDHERRLLRTAHTRR